MQQRISWNEIKEHFPNEWVALIEYDQKAGEEIDGVVVTHASDRREFHEKIAKLLPAYQNIAVRFTGNLIKNPEIPFLWQISPTA